MKKEAVQFAILPRRKIQDFAQTVAAA